MVAQLGIEPMTTRCLVVALTTKLLGSVFLVLTGACQFGHGSGEFTTNFIHSFEGAVPASDSRGG